MIFSCVSEPFHLLNFSTTAVRNSFEKLVLCICERAFLMNLTGILARLG